MMDLHKEAERLARLNETRTQERPHAPLMTITEPEPLGRETADTLRALSARLAKVEKERDEARARVAAVLGEAASLMVEGRPYAVRDHGEHSLIVHDMDARRDAILALARPEETDALDRIRAEEQARCVKVIEESDVPTKYILAAAFRGNE